MANVREKRARCPSDLFRTEGISRAILRSGLHVQGAHDRDTTTLESPRPDGPGGRGAGRHCQLLRAEGVSRTERELPEGGSQEGWEKKQYSIALGQLNRYLELHPDELDALDLKARFLAESAHDEPQALEAINIHKKVLGRDPQRQEVRRRLVELNLLVRGMGKTAVTYARDLIRRGDDSASAHRLLRAPWRNRRRKGTTPPSTPPATSLRPPKNASPATLPGAELLARLYQEKLNNTDKALAVLDRLLALDLKTPAKRAEVRLARAVFSRLNRQERAEAEVEKALPDAPDSREARLMAGQLAAQKGDTASARQHLAAIPEGERDDLRIKLVQGQIDLHERRPDDAIQSWRSGLLLTGGNNIELTWRLAQVQLDMGRVSEAEPLMAQYRRLAGGDEPDSWYRYLHALKLFKTNRIAEAIAELEAIQFKIDKGLGPPFYLLLGQSYEMVRNHDKALAAYRKAAELAPEQADPWLAIARLQWAKQPAEALDTLALGLKAAPESRACWPRRSRPSCSGRCSAPRPNDRGMRSKRPSPAPTPLLPTRPRSPSSGLTTC